MIEKYSTGVWWIDLLAVAGIACLTLLVLGFVAWAVADRFRHRRTDAAELGRLSPRSEERRSHG